MSNGTNETPLKITLDDLANVVVPESMPPLVGTVDASGQRSYGTITDAADKAPEVAEERGSFLLQGWFYLGAAGVLGAVAAWSACEHAFVDGEGHRWGNTWMVPLMLALMCLGFGVAESIVERSTKKALVRAAIALPLGIVLGFIFYFIANLIYIIGLGIVSQLGVQTNRNPGYWIARAVAWAVFGAAGGIVYGIAGQSLKKAQYGVLGGVIGAAIGGLIFDPISLATKAFTEGAAPSRAVGFALVGLATGVAMGFVESALKDRWLYVTSGPLAGKQFILYKNQTVIGSEQQCDIYLFKDPSIVAKHAVIMTTGSRLLLRAFSQVYVGGSPVQQRVLQDGDLIQIGRYAFRYKERHRS